jgi:hypothetical protein
MTAEQSKDLEALLTPYTFTKDEQEFRDWLKLNRETLAKYDAHEIFRFAVWDGFDADLVRSIVSSVTDLTAGSSLDRRAKFASFNTLCAMETAVKMRHALELADQPDFTRSSWVELATEFEGYDYKGE